MNFSSCGPLIHLGLRRTSRSPTRSKKGPVVRYFYPQAFTSGCNAEAHDFAEATPKFNALGVTVVGMPTDAIATLRTFSVEACRDKFAVAADAGGRITKRYDASIMEGVDMADRISCVISPHGKVLAVSGTAATPRYTRRATATATAEPAPTAAHQARSSGPGAPPPSALASSRCSHSSA